MASAIRIRLKGRDLTFPAAREITLGRDPKMDVRTDNPLVSRHHATLRPGRYGWILEDTKSKHGTFVNGQQITRVPVTGPLTVWLAEPNAGQVVLLLPQSVPSGIFISYRRDETSGEAGRLYDHLVAHFGEHMVFRDIDAIDPGTDFVGRIEEAVGSCQVLLALIGRSWLTLTGPNNQRRLDNQADFVRLELAAALRQGIRVIPVLVQDATMPNPEDLPEPLREFARRNAIELSDDRWNYDMSRLVSAIQKTITSKGKGRMADGDAGDQSPAPSLPSSRPASRGCLPQLLLPVAAVLAAWSTIHDRDPRRARNLLLIPGLFIGTVCLIAAVILA